MPGKLKMVKNKEGKMVPFYAADGRGKMKTGGKVLKKVKPSQKGLKKLPKKVRNKMGFLKKGGSISKRKAGGRVVKRAVGGGVALRGLGAVRRV